MPQQGSAGNNKNAKKKKKGRAPAHQNTFAFRHNPKSKKTAAILEAPIEGACRRCRDKLEWRKRYRKYKPLTQPSKCNLCQKRNVLAAYHTICASCAQSSPKAVQLLQRSQQCNKNEQSSSSSSSSQQAEIAAVQVAAENDTQAHCQLEHGKGTDEKSTGESTATPSPAQEEDEDSESSFSASIASQHINNARIDNLVVATRVCAICVKEPALSSENGDSGDNNNSGRAQESGRPLRLRERKTLERQRERAAASGKRNRNSEGEDEGNDDSENKQQQLDAAEVNDGMNRLAVYDDDDDDDETQDPFLQAVGGADKLLTGEAYQQNFLLEQQQQQT